MSNHPSEEMTQRAIHLVEHKKQVAKLKDQIIVEVRKLRELQYQSRELCEQIGNPMYRTLEHVNEIQKNILAQHAAEERIDNLLRELEAM